MMQIFYVSNVSEVTFYFFFNRSRISASSSS